MIIAVADMADNRSVHAHSVKRFARIFNGFGEEMNISTFL
ncbi:hypothetical protein B4098_3126 [Heyndrickxia coagulans]|uniref:Uncharacterized protein n=1 Tax=Heyndrickxia coagulans TaxID=1398 RepID=A0A150K5B1_HEYCO|nr:hypothetical protein B4098_3126 [Heyndrickxia coagulans]